MLLPALPIMPLVVGGSGAVGLRLCFATSFPALLPLEGDKRPFVVGGETLPLVVGGETRPFVLGGETRPLDVGGEDRPCNRVDAVGDGLGGMSITVGEPRPDADVDGTKLRNVSESRRRWT